MFRKKRKGNGIAPLTSNFKQIFKYQPNNLLQKIRILSDEEDFKTIKKLLKIITEYISLKEASENLLDSKYDFKIRNSNFMNIFHQICRTFSVEIAYSDFNKEFNINEQNLILDTWNHSRIITNLQNINEENILKPVSNINNYYIFPLDIVLCSGGNHSQLSGMIQKKGISHISRVADLSCLYPYIRFDGEKFIDIHNPNNFWDVESELELFSGVFFEIGRILKKHPYYFDLNLLEKLG